MAPIHKEKFAKFFAAVAANFTNNNNSLLNTDSNYMNDTNIDFNVNITTIFCIKEYNLNTPIYLQNLGGGYLAYNSIKNTVFFSKNEPDQMWIIEFEDNAFFIRLSNETQYKTCYLGSPNQDGSVYLYTSKNRFTKWNIEPTEPFTYGIRYIGEKFDSSDVKLVIARYSENVNWVLPYNDIAIIYNKGKLNIDGFKTVVNVENIGREGHTYLYHIIKNYDNLSSRVIFSQGDPFLHNETLLFGIDNYERSSDVQPLGIRWLRQHNIPPIDVEDKHKIITDYGLNYMTILLDTNLISSEFYDWGMEELNKNYRRDYKEDPNDPIISITNNFLTRSKFNIKNNLDTINFTYSALFSVVRSKILANTIENYKNLLSELLVISSSGGANGYVLEKLWLYIFE